MPAEFTNWLFLLLNAGGWLIVVYLIRYYGELIACAARGRVELGDDINIALGRSVARHDEMIAELQAEIEQSVVLKPEAVKLD